MPSDKNNTKLSKRDSKIAHKKLNPVEETLHSFKEVFRNPHREINNLKRKENVNLFGRLNKRGKIKVKSYILDHFFDGYLSSDSDITPYQSESENVDRKKTQTFNKGLNILMAANQNIDKCTQAKGLGTSFSNSKNSNFRSIPLRKFSVTENSFWPTQTQNILNRENEPEVEASFMSPPKDSEENQLSFIDQLLRLRASSTGSTEGASLQTAFVQQLMEPSRGIESLLTEYLISLPS